MWIEVAARLAIVRRVVDICGVAVVWSGRISNTVDDARDAESCDGGCGSGILGSSGQAYASSRDD